LQATRCSRFTLCERVFEKGSCPRELVDVEPAIDGGGTILHYLCPPDLNTGPLANISALCATSNRSSSPADCSSMLNRTTGRPVRLVRLQRESDLRERKRTE
jgi:hypothetical protein